MLDMLMDTNETSDSTQDQTLNHWVISYVQWWLNSNRKFPCRAARTQTTINLAYVEVELMQCNYATKPAVNGNQDNPWIGFHPSRFSKA